MNNFQQFKIYILFFWDYDFVLELEGYIIRIFNIFLVQETLPSSQKILVQKHRVTIDVFYFLNCFYL